MNLIDLMNIWAINNGANNPKDMLMNIDLDERIDKELLCQQIVIKCGNLTPLFNTSWSYEEFHKHWFKYHKGEIQKLIDTTMYEYNALETFTRYENLSHNADELTNTSDVISSEHTVDSKSNKTSEEKISAYNEDVYQPNNKIEDTRKSTDSTNGADSREYVRDRGFNSSDDNTIHGNNGLYSNQQLIKQERDIAEFNVMEWIVKKYMRDGFLLVY